MCQKWINEQGFLPRLLVICLCMSMLENKYQVMICIDHYSIIIHPIYKGLVRLQSATVPGILWHCLWRQLFGHWPRGGHQEEPWQPWWHKMASQHHGLYQLGKKWIEKIQIKFVYNLFIICLMENSCLHSGLCWCSGACWDSTPNDTADFKHWFATGGGDSW